MKRFALILTIVFSISLVNAQKAKITVGLNYIQNQQLDKAIEAIDAAMVHEKTKDWAKAHYAKGKLLQALYDADNPAFSDYSEKPLIEAYDCYNKAFSLDEKGKMKNQINLALIVLVNQFVNKGVDHFGNGEYAESLVYFEYSLEVGKMDVFQGEVDTAIVFNAGLAANNAQNYEKAIKYFSMTKDMQYGGPDVYSMLKTVYMLVGDSVNAINTLKEGFELYTASNLIFEIIYYYLITNANDKSLEYIQLAKENEPDNSIFYFVEGTVYENLDNPEDAIKAYERSIELDPEYFEPYFNLAVFYYNTSKDIYDQCNEIDDFDEYEACKAKGDDELKKSLPYLEKAITIKPEDLVTLETLKTVYYRLQMNDEYEAVMQKIEDIKNK